MMRACRIIATAGAAVLAALVLAPTSGADPGVADCAYTIQPGGPTPTADQVAACDTENFNNASAQANYMASQGYSQLAINKQMVKMGMPDKVAADIADRAVASITISIGQATGGLITSTSG